MKYPVATFTICTISVFAAMFTAPIVAQYFWNAFLVDILGIAAPAYWSMFTILLGVRWLLLADMSFTLIGVSNTVKSNQSTEDKFKELQRAVVQPWAHMGLIALLTYFCK